MFSKKISSRDLFSGSQSTEQSNLNDFSQLPHAEFTQFDMSQPQSQVFFSQDQYSAGSNSQSQGMRAPVLEKYMPKPSLFKCNSQSRISTLSRPGQENQVLPGKLIKPNIQTFKNQQQLSMQQIRPKEKDERNLLSSIVNIVQECTDEVKQSVKYVRSAELDNGDVFQSAIRSLTDTLEESSSKILKAVKVKEEHTTMVSALHREIMQKDERIQELLKLKMCEEGESSSLLNSVKIFILEQQSQSEQKIQKLLDNIQQQIKLTKELVNSNRHGFEENNKHIIDVKHANARHVEDIEKRLLDELVSVRDGFDRQRQDLETFFRHQILPAQQKHLHTFEKHVQKSMTEGLSQVPDRAEEMILERHSELKAFHKSQQRDLEKYIKSQSTEQSNKIIKQSQELYSKQQKIFHKEINKTLETFTNEHKQVIDENKNYLSELKKCDKDYYRPWQNENVPKLIQDKLDELHSYHQSEIKRLETEIENQHKQNKMINRGAYTRSDAEDAVDNILQNVYDLQQNCNDPIESRTKINHGSMFKKGPGLLSPRPLQGISWNSRTLFGRTNPSPIAKVMPQRKQGRDTIVTAKNAVEAINANKHSNDTNTQIGLLNNVHRENEDIQASTHRQKSVRFSPDTRLDSGLRSKTTVEISNAVLQSINLKKQQMKKPGRKHRGKKKRPEGNIYLNPGNTQLNIKVQSSQRNTDKCQIIRKDQNKNSINYERRQAENSMTSPEGMEISDISQASTVCSDIFSPRNIFEFHDELSPGPTLRKQNQTSVVTAQTLAINESKGKWLAASDSASGNSDGNSSPPLSVTDIFIPSAMEDKRSAEENDNEYRRAVLSDFQLTPNLNELFTDMDEQYVSTNCKRDLQDVRPLRRIAEKRKLCD